MRQTCGGIAETTEARGKRQLRCKRAVGRVGLGNRAAEWGGTGSVGGKLNVMGHTAIGYGVRRINMKNLRRKSEIWRGGLIYPSEQVFY